jgi:hypothetical protein
LSVDANLNAFPAELPHWCIADGGVHRGSIRLRGMPTQPSPKPNATIADSMSLARMVLALNKRWTKHLPQLKVNLQR